MPWSAGRHPPPRVGSASLKIQLNELKLTSCPADGPNPFLKKEGPKAARKGEEGPTCTALTTQAGDVLRVGGLETDPGEALRGGVHARLW